MHNRRPRAGYTLLEVLFALALAVVLLAGLYMAVESQFKLAQAGRTVVERTTLTRAAFQLMSADIQAATTLCDPARYRRTDTGEADPGVGSAETTGTTETTGSALGGTIDPTGNTTGTTTSGTTTGGTPATGTTGTTMGTTTTTTSPTASGAVSLRVGVWGDSASLTLMTAKWPKECWKPVSNLGRNSDTNVGLREDGTQLVGDQRQITYWMASTNEKGMGLARWEQKIVTSDDALEFALPEGEEQGRYIIVPEARSVQFEYFDGSAWYESWDSNQIGADGVTPQGPPRAIRITMEIDLGNAAAAGSESGFKTLRHVVAINTANGTAEIVPETMPEGGTTTPPATTTPATGTTDSTGTTTP